MILKKGSIKKDKGKLVVIGIMERGLLIER
jgi:hypothetical protein